MKFKIFFLAAICLSLTAEAQTNKPTYAGARAKKTKTDAKKAVPKPRKVAHVQSFECKVTRYNAKGSSEETKKLTDKVKFLGIEPHEEVTMTNTAGKYTMSVNAFLDTPVTPYIIDSLTCDDYLNCSGARQIFSSKGVKVKKFQIAPNGSSSHAILGSADVFRFERVKNGFSFSAIQVKVSASTFYGVKVICEAK